MHYKKMRVLIPGNPVDLLELARKIHSKHMAEGSSSPLGVISANNWGSEGPNIQQCLERHCEAEYFRGKMEQAYQERDSLLKGIHNAVRASRDVLSGVHHDCMEQMSDWGFDVVRSRKPGPKKYLETNS